MKRVVVDTNVLVSGIFWLGPPNAIIKAWQNGAFRWIVSPEILEEYRRVLEDIATSHSEIQFAPILELIGINCEMVIAEPVHGICRDPYDDQFIAAALSGKADFIVMGDKALKDIGTYRGIQVVNPALLLRRL